MQDLESRPQQRRRDERGAEHDRDDRGVEIGVEHALGETDAREDQSDLASGQHAEPDEEPIADAAEEPEPGGDLADARNDDQCADQGEEARVAERVEVGVDPDLRGRTPG